MKLGAAAGIPARGAELRAELADRIEAVREATASAPPVRTLALEWLDPPFTGGHWIPEMIDAAGGIDALGTEPGARSRDLSWHEVGASSPDVVAVMPCGLHAEEAEREARRHRADLEALGAEAIHAVDAASSFSRPGPRLADGVFVTSQVSTFRERGAQAAYDQLEAAAYVTRTWGDCYGYFMVATGRADIVLDPIMNPWDLLPLIPIIRGAGGVISDWQGKDAVSGTSSVAANPQLHPQVIEILN